MQPSTNLKDTSQTENVINEETIKTLRRIASLNLHELSHEKVADIVGIDLEALYRIYESKPYKDIFSQMYYDEIEKQEILKEGWDGVEAQALSQIVDSLNDGRVDPEFALRAAMIANKAQRRSINNRPLNAKPAEGKCIILQLRQTFVNSVNERQKDVVVIKNKEENGLNPKAVEQMFMLDNDTRLEDDDFDLEAMLSNVGEI